MRVYDLIAMSSRRQIQPEPREGLYGYLLNRMCHCASAPCNIRIALGEIVPDGVLLTPFSLGCFVSYRKASACFARVPHTNITLQTVDKFAKVLGVDARILVNIAEPLKTLKYTTFEH